MKSRGARVTSVFGYRGDCAGRLFSSVPSVLLPHTKAALFRKSFFPFQTALLNNIEAEYLNNPICQPLLAQVEQLILAQQLKVIISPSLAADKYHLERFKTICGYDRQTKTLLLPSSSAAHGVIHPETKSLSKHRFYENQDVRYLCMFLHEANHAHDFIIGGFNINASDSRVLLARQYSQQGLFADDDMRKIERVLSVNYAHNGVNQLKIAFKTDLIRLYEIANDDQHEDQQRAKDAIHYLKESLLHYSVIEILFEFKSRFVEFSASGSLGAAFMQEMFPAVTSWYLYQHMPACQDELNRSVKLRM